MYLEISCLMDLQAQRQYRGRLLTQKPYLSRIPNPNGISSDTARFRSLVSEQPFQIILRFIDQGFTVSWIFHQFNMPYAHQLPCTCSTVTIFAPTCFSWTPTFLTSPTMFRQLVWACRALALLRKNTSPRSQNKDKYHLNHCTSANKVGIEPTNDEINTVYYENNYNKWSARSSVKLHVNCHYP